MEPGPNKVIKCSTCGALAWMATLRSGNTFGARWWIDGKMDAPMLPDQPAIAGCKSCANFFWVSEAEVVGQVYSNPFASRLPGEWKNAERVEHLSEEELIEALAAGMARNREQEMYLRIRAWWASNDPFRERLPGESAHPAPLRSKAATANMERLMELADGKKPDERVMRAELARELGRFDEAIQLLRYRVAAQFQTIAAMIRQLARDRDCTIREMTDE